MKVPLFFWPLCKREIRALCAHRLLILGLVASLGIGITIATIVDSPEARLWVSYQIIYYMVPLLTLLVTIMIVRQDLREGPLLALLPGSSTARVTAKSLAAGGYLVLVLSLLFLPSVVAGMAAWQSWLSLATGSVLLMVFFLCMGVWQGFRARHEVRAYLGGLGWWIVFLFRSAALAYGAHVLLVPSVTPSLTLISLMANPLESFRLFVFFGLSTVPMNPHTGNPIALWWMSHSLLWLTVVVLLLGSFPLFHAGYQLRLRAHQGD